MSISKEILTNKENWKKANVQVFWGEIAPCDHLVQIYENDETFLDILEGFVSTGFLAKESVIIIATPEHIVALNKRLLQRGFDLEALMVTDMYFALDAHEMLSKIIRNNWPDEAAFIEIVATLIQRARKAGSKVRAFGEMVAILWSQGMNGATVRLESLWNKLHEQKDFTLYCAYPKSGFTQSAHHSLNTICQAHSRVIDGRTGPATEIYYRTV